ncbi:MAG TPA: methyltransferase domain-containing protein [Chryseolinea sp.]
MKTDDAKALIAPGIPAATHNSRWADLGCGSGIFTTALAGLLQSGSKIYAVDKENLGQEIPGGENVEIEFLVLDFITDAFPFSALDGILMANSLHFVKDKSGFIEKLKRHLTSKGHLIIVEYDTDRHNRWVPYPISFANLAKTFSAAGFTSIKKIGERNSVYRPEKIYASRLRVNH